MDSYLPEHQPTLGGTQDEDISNKHKTADAFGEGDESLLISAQARVDMHMGLLVLCGKDVRVVEGETVGGTRALLEGGLDGVGRRQRMRVDANILGDSRISGEWRTTDGGDELLRESHGRWYVNRCVLCLRVRPCVSDAQIEVVKHVISMR
jgi:hypothetical protein